MIKKRTQKKIHVGAGWKDWVTLEGTEAARQASTSTQKHIPAQWFTHQQEQEALNRKTEKDKHNENKKRIEKLVDMEVRRDAERRRAERHSYWRNLLGCEDPNLNECSGHKGMGVLKKKRKTMRKHKPKPTRKVKRKPTRKVKRKPARKNKRKTKRRK